MRVSGITQRLLPHTPWDDPALSRMPGMKPVEGPWIVVDEAYGEQMAERARLMRESPEAVFAIQPVAEAAMEELLEVVLAGLPVAFAQNGNSVRCPDGRLVSVTDTPHLVLNALLQEDLCLLEKQGGEHVLIAGLVCFPSHWTLAEKIGRPLVRIHRPIESYDTDVAMRVQRLFDRAVAGRPMWRSNVLPHVEAVLHRPKPEFTPREPAGSATYIRSERQTILRLPHTGVVLFAIHTWIVALSDLTDEQRLRCPIG